MRRVKGKHGADLPSGNGQDSLDQMRLTRDHTPLPNVYRHPLDGGVQAIVFETSTYYLWKLKGTCMRPGRKTGCYLTAGPHKKLVDSLNYSYIHSYIL